MKIIREFKLMSNRMDAQYISHLNNKGQPAGYDRKKEYAIDLTDWQAMRCMAYLRDIGAKYTIED